MCVGCIDFGRGLRERGGGSWKVSTFMTLVIFVLCWCLEADQIRASLC